MMEETFVISDYCIIRNNRVWLNGQLLFERTQESPVLFFTEAYRFFTISYPKFFKMDNLCKLGFLAAELILRDENMNQTCAGEEVGLILSNAGSSIDTDRNHQRSITDPMDYFPSPSVFVYTLANVVIGEICIRHKLTGESTFFIEREFDPVRMHAYVQQLLSEGVMKCCLTGWTEMDGDRYDAVLYFIRKSAGHKKGIAIFEPEILRDMYMQSI